MLESLAFALVKTFITFTFEQYLDHAQSVRIENAPKWYLQQSANHICDSAFAEGGLESIDKAKGNARQAMVIRINKALDSVVYEHFRNRTDPTEKALIERFKNDENLPVFVESAVIYENVEYREKVSTAFTRVCIPRERMQTYQEERVAKLQKTVTLHRRDRAFDAFDAEFAAPRR